MVINGLQYDFKNNAWTVTKNVSNHDTEIRIQSTIDGFPIIAIDSKVFADNMDLECIHIPQSVAFIGSYAFVGCQNLKYVKEIPAAIPTLGLLVISQEAFADCNSLRTFKTSRIISLNGGQNFQRCHKLEMIGANHFYGDIPHHAFQGCISLSSLILEKNSNIIIEQDALDWCPFIKDIFVKAPNVSCDNGTLECLRLKRIHCKPDCNLVDLGYEGGEIIIE